MAKMSLEEVEEIISKIKEANDKNYNSETAINNYAKECFTQFIKSEKGRHDSIALDSDGKWLKRRCKAINKILKILESEFGEKYKLINIPKAVVPLCTKTYYPFDVMNNKNDLLYAASIWILDRLKVSGKLKEAFTDVPNYYYIGSEVVRMPIVNDLEHDSDIIHNLMYIIQNRHKGLNIESDRGTYRHILDEFNASGRKPQESTEYLDEYNAILDLIPEKDKKEAVEKFKSVYLNFIDVFLEGYQNRELKKLELFKNFEETFKNVRLEKEILSQRPSLNQIPILKLPLNDKQCLTFDEDEAYEKITKAYGDYCKQSKIVGIYSNNFWRAYHREDRVILSDDSGEILEKVKSIDIGDLFANCFALIYLADCDDDFIWSYGAAMHIMWYVSNLLPWKTIDSSDKKSLDSYYRGDNWLGVVNQYGSQNSDEKMAFDWYKIDSSLKMFASDEVLSCNEIAKISPDLINEIAKITPALINEGLPNEPDVQIQKPINMLRTSYSSLVYYLTGFIMPRIHRNYGEIPKRLEREGASKEDIRLICSLVDIMQAISDKRNGLDAGEFEEIDVDSPNQPIVDEIDGEFANQSGVDKNTISNEELKKEIAKLKEENKRIREQANSSDKQWKLLAEENEQQSKKIKSLTSELAELRELAYRYGNQDVPEDDEQELPIEFPYTVNHAFTVFGGHDSWKKAIKPKLHNVKFVDNKVVPKADLVKNADAVWIQTNCYGHSYFWKIIELAKNYGVQIHYFIWSSAERCACQMVKVDNEIVD